MARPTLRRIPRTTLKARTAISQPERTWTSEAVPPPAISQLATMCTSTGRARPPRSTTEWWSFRPELGAMSRSKGFSLVELAVALAIIALLLAGALIPLSTQIDVRNSGDTQRGMESIRDAIVGFAQANGRLPCPANGATPAGTVDTTTWFTAGGAGAAHGGPPHNPRYTTVGGVPRGTLGGAETDALGRPRFF